MKATGIVRRIDDLGRVVIPKEIRRTLRIREGDPLEIFTDREGEFLQVLGDREVLTACQGDDRYVKVTEEMNEYEDEVISPIISAGDIIGAVVLLNKDKKKHFGEVEQRVAVSAADFLGRQME